MTGARIEVDALTVRHVGRRAPALRGLSLDWREGEVLLLLGPSGSGKSTLALCLDGLIPHAIDAHWEAGRILVDGRDTRTTELRELTSTVGVLFQDPETQLTMLEVDDEIAFGLENLGIPRDEMGARVAQARHLMGLVGRRVPERLASLSGGQKQRVALAALLAMRPRALVLDEPTANLDPEGARAVLDAIASLASDGGRSLLLVEHRLDEVLALVDRIAVLDRDGGLALAGSPDDVFVAGAERLDELGVWIPQLRQLARLLGADDLPRDASAAAELIVERWPALTERAAGSAAGGDPIMLPAGPVMPPAGPVMPPADPVIELEHVTHTYAKGAPPALRDVSLEIRRGEYVALVGPNGAGKSTLGLLVADALHPSSGRIVRRAPTAYVFQYPEHQFVSRTVAGEIRTALPPGADGTIEARTTASLARIGLDALAEASPFTLSHGQKRRLSVATALAADPEVLVLDEPTFGQDRAHTERLMATLDELHAAGKTVVVITHDLTLVADHARRVVELADGSIAFDGSTAGYFARPGARLPPVADAFRRARAIRPELPWILGLAEARRALAA